MGDMLRLIHYNINIIVPVVLSASYIMVCSKGRHHTPQTTCMILIIESRERYRRNIILNDALRAHDTSRIGALELGLDYVYRACQLGGVEAGGGDRDIGVRLCVCFPVLRRTGLPLPTALTGWAFFFSHGDPSCPALLLVVIVGSSHEIMCGGPRVAFVSTPSVYGIFGCLFCYFR